MLERRERREESSLVGSRKAGAQEAAETPPKEGQYDCAEKGWSEA
jgi:hypothetical protein